MAIISKGSFSGVTITGDDAKRFIQRMRTVKHNPTMTASAERGRAHLATIRVARDTELKTKGEHHSPE